MATIDIISPLPGTFYRKPDPDSPPFAEVGDTIAAGAVIGLVEVMKQYSELTADEGGTIVSFEVADGDAVEAGQVVAVLEG